MSTVYDDLLEAHCWEFISLWTLFTKSEHKIWIENVFFCNETLILELEIST